MAYDGHIVCDKCHRTLYLGKHKDGRFWPGDVDESQFAAGVLQFLNQHFAHGKLLVLGDDPYERYLEACLESEWPTTVFVNVDHSGVVHLVEHNWRRPG